MFAILASAWIVPGLVGPAIAGGIGEAVGWRPVFLGLLPMIVVSAALTMPSLLAIGRPAADEPGQEAARTAFRRLPFAVAVAVGAGLILGGLSSDAPLILVGLVVAGLVVGLPALARLVPAGTLTARSGIPAAVLVRGLMTFAFFSVYAYIPFALTELRGLSTAEAGVALTSATIAWTAGAWVTARLVARLGEGRLVRVGLVLMGFGLFASMLVLTPVLPPLVGVLTFGLAGLGIGIAYSPISLIVLALAPPREIGTATSGLQLSDVLGESLGTGVTGAILAFAVRSALPADVPLAAAFVLGLAVGIVIVMAVMGRALFAVVLDEESARVAGLPVDGINTALAVLTAVTIVAAMRVVGVLLVAALMVLPVASAQQVSRSFRTTVTWAVGFGAASVVVGLAAARVWALAAGATIVLVAGFAYALTTAVMARLRRPWRGLEGAPGPGLSSRP